MKRRAILRKANIIIACSILLLLLMTWAPVVFAAPHKQTSLLFVHDVGTTIVQGTPTVDSTITALNKEKLTQEVNQLRNQNNWWWNFSTAFITATAAILGIAIGIYQWWRNYSTTLDKDRIARQDAQDKDRIARQDAQDKDRIARQDAQDKDLKDRQDERAKQAEERFQKVVDGLGSDKEQMRIGAAILLHTFLQPDYEQFYKQAFELAVANLRLQPPLEDVTQPPSSLNQALVAILRDVFPDLRKSLMEQYKEKDYLNWDIVSRVLDAGYVKLDKAYLYDAHLEQIFMPDAFLQYAILQGAHLFGAYLKNAHLGNADLSGADLMNTDLSGADLSGADLTFANLSGARLPRAILNGAILDGAVLKKTDIPADLSGANLTNAKLRVALALKDNIYYNVDLTEANLTNTNFTGADLSGADLTNANLTGANLTGAHPEAAKSLIGTIMRDITGLTKEQIDACKKRGATVEDTTTGATHSPVTEIQASSSDLGG